MEALALLSLFLFDLLGLWLIYLILLAGVIRYVFRRKSVWTVLVFWYGAIVLVLWAAIST